MKKIILNLFTLFLALGTLTTKSAIAATNGDYDGDGLADTALIDADEPEDKTTVFVRQSSNGGIKSYVFKPYGNFVISGNFHGDGKTYPGIVSVPSKSSSLKWVIKTPSGVDQVFNFGARGDDVPNQGDIDCDGKTDFIIVGNGTANFFPGDKIWTVKRSSTGTTNTTVFGKTGEASFTADMDGDGCSEIISLSSNFVWSSRSFYGGNTTEILWGAAGDIPLVPADINGDNLADYAIARKTGGNQISYVLYSNFTSEVHNLGSNNSVPMIGNFFGRNTFGWVDRSRGRVSQRTLTGAEFSFSFGNSRRGLLRPDGTEVTESENGTFGSSSNSSSNSGSNNSSSGSNDVDCDSFISRRDGSGGFKNNPKNSKGTLKIMFPKSMTGKISNVKVYADGDEVDKLRLGGYEWGNRERYYGSKKLKSYPNDLTVAAFMKTGRVICVDIPDAENVYD